MLEEYELLNDELERRNEELNKEIERLNNDIKELLKENSNKEKVIIAQDNIIKEVREYIEKTKFKYCDDELCYMIENHYNNILEILDKE